MGKGFLIAIFMFLGVCSGAKICDFSQYSVNFSDIFSQIFDFAQYLSHIAIFEHPKTRYLCTVKI